MQDDKQRRQEMFSLIEAWQNSGLSQRAYCAQHSLRYSLFHYWYKQYRERQTPSVEKASFVPLNIHPFAVTASVELLLTDGRRLIFHQGVSADYLKALIR